MFLSEKNESTLMDVKYTENLPVRVIDSYSTTNEEIRGLQNRIQ